MSTLTLATFERDFTGAVGGLLLLLTSLTPTTGVTFVVDVLAFISYMSELMVSIRLVIPWMAASAASTRRLMFNTCHMSPAGVLLSRRSIVL